MKKLLFYILSIQLILTINSAVMAQQGGGRRGNMEPKEFAERQTNQMKESLELSDKQLPKIEALNLKYAEKMKAARDEAGDDRDAMRSSMTAMMKEKDVVLKQILTEEQWTKFEKERKERMQNRQGGGGRRGI